MEFTGEYYRCEPCGHIWDYSDLCPNCGKDDMEDLNAKEVLQWSKASVPIEQERLEKMLKYHDDL